MIGGGMRLPGEARQFGDRVDDGNQRVDGGRRRRSVEMQGEEELPNNAMQRTSGAPRFQVKHFAVGGAPAAADGERWVG